MPERRALVDGLKPEQEAGRAFVYGEKPVPKPEPIKEVKTGPQFYGQGRVPITMRVRHEVAAALKRMSLERQLAGIEPNAMQDMVEEALEQWLDKNARPEL